MSPADLRGRAGIGFVDGRTTAQIAAELGLTYAATAQRLHRTLAALRQGLGGTASGP
jgi:DNA-directed RNA polymerase specialized sigma24 family protein